MQLITTSSVLKSVTDLFRQVVGKQVPAGSKFVELGTRDKDPVLTLWAETEGAVVSVSAVISGVIFEDETPALFHFNHWVREIGQLPGKVFVTINTNKNRIFGGFGEIHLIAEAERPDWCQPMSPTSTLARFEIPMDLIHQQVAVGQTWGNISRLPLCYSMGVILEEDREHFFVLAANQNLFAWRSEFLRKTNAQQPEPRTESAITLAEAWIPNAALRALDRFFNPKKWSNKIVVFSVSEEDGEFFFSFSHPLVSVSARYPVTRMDELWKNTPRHLIGDPKAVCVWAKVTDLLVETLAEMVGKAKQDDLAIIRLHAEAKKVAVAFIGEMHILDAEVEDLAGNATDLVIKVPLVLFAKSVLFHGQPSQVLLQFHVSGQESWLGINRTFWIRG